MVILGSVASRKPRSVKICELVSRMVWSMVSAITERPYIFFRWLTGTLPGRKPLRRTLSLRSTRRASALASRSDAGTLIWNSCFNPSATVSFTCMASIFFPLGPAETPGHCQSGRRPALKPESGFGKTTWRVVVEVPKPLRKLLEGKPRFIRSLRTDRLHQSDPPEPAVVAEWKRQINHLERRGPDKVSEPRQGVPPEIWLPASATNGLVME